MKKFQITAKTKSGKAADFEVYIENQTELFELKTNEGFCLGNHYKEGSFIAGKVKDLRPFFDLPEHIKGNIDAKICISSDLKEILELLEKNSLEKAAKRKTQITKAKKELKITGFLKKVGCDWGNTHYYSYKYENEYPDDIKREAQREISETNETAYQICEKLELPYKALEADGTSYYGCEFGEIEANIIYQKAKEQIEKEEKEKQKKEEKKEAKEKIKEEKYKEKIEEAEENEILYFGTEPLAKVDLMLLHSIGAMEKENKIQVYTTRDCRTLKGKSTYDLKGNLKSEGFKWNSKSKDWEIELNEENKELVMSFLKKYDVKGEASHYDMVQCWECGCWVKKSQCTMDGGGWYCGC